MYKYRISKYDPQYRNAEGVYTKEEWTSYDDIGKTYNGRLFTKEEYIKTEELYCKAILNILKNENVNKMLLTKVEIYFSVDEIKQIFQSKGLSLSVKEESIVRSLKNEDIISIENLELYLKLILRECFWGEIVDSTSLIHIEFGYDYYVYLWCQNTVSNEIIEAYKREKIFLEMIDGLERAH